MANPETYRIDLDDIEDVDEDEISEHRLDDLENGYSPFDEVLNSRSDLYNTRCYE